MRKIFLLLALSVTIISCKKKPGVIDPIPEPIKYSLTIEVTKLTAGENLYLKVVSENDKSKIWFETKTALNGTYKIDNIPSKLSLSVLRESASAKETITASSNNQTLKVSTGGYLSTGFGGGPFTTQVVMP